MDDSEKVIKLKKRLNTHKSLRIYAIERLKEFENGKISIDKIKAYSTILKTIDMLLCHELDIADLDELRDELNEIKAINQSRRKYSNG